jgi:hypothetical protein
MNLKYVGVLRAYVFTKKGGFNEITTTQLIPLDRWIHVFFARSLTTGMHIFVNGQEQTVTVTAGVANPSGEIMRQNEIYIGHDAICTIDELRISNSVESTEQPLWVQWWFWTATMIAIVAGGSLITYFKKRANGISQKKYLE